MKTEISEEVYINLRDQGVKNISMEASYFLLMNGEAPVNDEAAAPVAAKKRRTVKERTRFATDRLSLSPNWQFNKTGLRTSLQELTDEVNVLLECSIGGRLMSRDFRKMLANQPPLNLEPEQVSQGISSLIKNGILLVNAAPPTPMQATSGPLFS